MRLIFAIFLSLFVVVSPVSARDYYYFNKPGVDRDTYLEDRLRFEVEKKLIREIEKIEDEGEQVDRYFELASRPDAIGEEMYE